MTDGAQPKLRLWVRHYIGKDELMAKDDKSLPNSRRRKRKMSSERVLKKVISINNLLDLRSLLHTTGELGRDEFIEEIELPGQKDLVKITLKIRREQEVFVKEHG